MVLVVTTRWTAGRAGLDPGDRVLIIPMRVQGASYAYSPEDPTKMVAVETKFVACAPPRIC